MGDSDQPSSTERVVMDVWRDVFKLETVSRTDDVFELGVDSLAAMDMCLRLANIFKIEVTPAQLLTTPSVAELAGFIDEQSALAQNEAGSG